MCGLRPPRGLANTSSSEPARSCPSGVSGRSPTSAANRQRVPWFGSCAASAARMLASEFIDLRLAISYSLKL